MKFVTFYHKVVIVWRIKILNFALRKFIQNSTSKKMKTIKLLLFAMMLVFAGGAQSQFRVSLHIGTAPDWGPSGYSDVRYYYLPDVEAYYDIRTSNFIYISGHQWVHRTYLPYRYRNYNLYNGYKVVMNDYRGNAPYTYFRQHKVKYARGYRGHEQHSIREIKHREADRGRSHGNVHEDRNQRNRMENNNNRRSYEHVNVQNNRHTNALEKKHDNGNDNGLKHKK